MSFGAQGPEDGRRASVVTAQGAPGFPQGPGGWHDPLNMQRAQQGQQRMTRATAPASLMAWSTHRAAVALWYSCWQER